MIDLILDLNYLVILLGVTDTCQESGNLGYRIRYAEWVINKIPILE